MKTLFTIDELITHMKSKGIKFNIISEEQAKSFLCDNNYYMKLASYRKNYPKYQTGKKKENTLIWNLLIFKSYLQ